MPPARRVTGVDLKTDLLGALDECREFPGSIAGRRGSGLALNVPESISTQPLITQESASREMIGPGPRTAQEPPHLRYRGAALRGCCGPAPLRECRGVGE